MYIPAGTVWLWILLMLQHGNGIPITAAFWPQQWWNGWRAHVSWLYEAGASLVTEFCGIIAEVQPRAFLQYAKKFCKSLTSCNKFLLVSTTWILVGFCLVLLLTILEELFINVVIINCHQNTLWGTQEPSKQSLVLCRTILHANQSLKNLTFFLNFYRGVLCKWKLLSFSTYLISPVFLYNFSEK